MSLFQVRTAMTFNGGLGTAEEKKIRKNLIQLIANYCAIRDNSVKPLVGFHPAKKHSV